MQRHYPLPPPIPPPIRNAPPFVMTRPPARAVAYRRRRMVGAALAVAGFVATAVLGLMLIAATTGIKLKMPRPMSRQERINAYQRKVDRWTVANYPLDYCDYHDCRKEEYEAYRE